jgi:hypothetical protein
LQVLYFETFYVLTLLQIMMLSSLLHKKLFAVLALTILSFGSLLAQQTEDNKDSLVQFSGLVMSSDSLMALQDVHIRVKGNYYGTASNNLGIFTIVAKKGDTVSFSCLGYKYKEYAVPTNLSGQRYSMVLTLSQDTLLIDTIFIKPFISRALLPHYFVTVDVPEDEMELIARRNLESEFLRQQAAMLEADGPENQKLQLRQQAQKYYYSGQTVPINILNPFAWAQFIKAWKNGDFKRKKETYK